MNHIKLYRCRCDTSPMRFRHLNKHWNSVRFLYLDKEFGVCLQLTILSMLWSDLFNISDQFPHIHIKSGLHLTFTRLASHPPVIHISLGYGIVSLKITTLTSTLSILYHLTPKILDMCSIIYSNHLSSD